MANSPTIDIFAASAAQVAYLSDLVRMAGYVPVTGQNDRAVLSLNMADGGLSVVRQDAVLRKMILPVRAGDVMGVLQKIMSEAEALPSRFAIGDGELDVRDSLWMREGEPALRLTEKEVAILVTLKNADGKAVGRQALLDQVWAYAQGVETHTLETHIYRLRQKIESDPANPKILLTQEDGYILGA